MSLAALAALPGHAGAAVAQCDGTPDATRAESAPTRLRAQCGGRTECQPNDTLEVVVSAPKNELPDALCLRVANAPAATLRVPLSAVEPAGSGTDVMGTRSGALAFGPLIGRLLNPTSFDAGFAGAFDRMTQPKVALELFDAAGPEGRLYRRLTLDTSTLWQSGLLTPTIAAASCAKSPCRFGADLSLDVPNLGAWRAATKSDPYKIQLLLGGARLAGLPTQVDERASRITYTLTRDNTKSEQVAAWRVVLRAAANGSDTLSVGLADDKGQLGPSRTSIAFDAGVDGLWLALSVFLVGWAIGAAAVHAKGRWLRDSAPVRDPAIQVAMPFSLGRMQMAVWTVIVVASLLYMAIGMGDYAALNGTSLALMGLGAATALGSIATNTLSDDQKNAVKSYSDATTALGSLQPAAAGFAQAQQAVVTARQALLKSIGSSGSPLKDMLFGSDDATALHRLQIVLFTLFLGGLYLWSVAMTRTVPTFTDTQLALMGVSGGTYLGFKLATR